MSERFKIPFGGNLYLFCTISDAVIIRDDCGMWNTLFKCGTMSQNVAGLAVRQPSLEETSQSQSHR